MSKHTPKPWIITHQNGMLPDEGLVGIAGPPTVNSHGHEVRMYVAQYVLPENAKLIVAVHELLEALEELVGQVEEAGWHSEITESARAAIAKAKVET